MIPWTSIWVWVIGWAGVLVLESKKEKKDNTVIALEILKKRYPKGEKEKKEYEEKSQDIKNS